MPTPAFIDLSLYLPQGGVNAFEVNGAAVNGAAFVDSPFAGVDFAPDPYRSILSPGRREADLVAPAPSLVNFEPNSSVQVDCPNETLVPPPRTETTLEAQRLTSKLFPDDVSLAIEVEDVSYVRSDYRVSFVRADHPSSRSGDISLSSVEVVPASQTNDEVDVSYVPAEDRTSTVRRI